MEPAPNQPEEFEKLQRLLALKRHEEPPPGYFDRLPGQIRARIAHAEAHPEPFWRRWLEAWDVSPALATSYAVAVVALLGAAVWLTRPPGASDGRQLVAAPPVDTNQNPALIASNSAPPGLFNPPTLQVQPASAPKR
jgi:hypothetical protein